MSRQKTDLSNFETALWGYDRQQVQRYVDQLHARLNEAVDGLGATAVLHRQLNDAQMELHRLRQAGRKRPETLLWGDRISYLLEAATEQADAIRAEAERDAAEIRARAERDATAALT